MYLMSTMTESAVNEMALAGYRDDEAGRSLNEIAKTFTPFLGISGDSQQWRVE